MQHTAIFHARKNDNFHLNLIFAQNIDCGYTLEPPQSGSSNEYPQCIFWSKNKKIMYTPVNPSFTIYKWGVRGFSLHRLVFVMKVTPDLHLAYQRSIGPINIPLVPGKRIFKGDLPYTGIIPIAASWSHDQHYIYKFSKANIQNMVKNDQVVLEKRMF